ncbi:MAG: glycoside hydrolase family 127 protein [Lentisphaeria bacterium]|nr:glycoside hydrolase family 127 protein [Lentisphaeria bacterium]
MNFKNYRCAEISKVSPEDVILKRAIETDKKSTIPSSLAKCYETGRIDAFKLNWKEGMPNQPHIYWDSDVAKVLEGVANILSIYPDAELEAEYDKIVDLIVSSQQKDGYLNSYYTTIEPEKRWTKLWLNHELYCAGHLIEAAVAGYERLGKTKLLDAVCRYADYIDSVFGREEGKKRGYPGHQEIELALVRLYHATGNEKYFKLAKYFIDERAQSPHYYKEVEKVPEANCLNIQAHKPVREQTEAVGHAVRAVYMYSGMADVARLSNDEELFRTCEKLFDNIIQKRMYITGGIGSSFFGEVFTIDYDLQNSSLMYAESCAAMGFVRFSSRMLNATGDGKYAEIIEKAIFNGVLSGISLSGDKFFYTNYLEVDDNTKIYNHGAKERQKWFTCSCCPTSFCRFLPETLQYIWSTSDDELRLNIPVANNYKSSFGEVEVKSLYPYDGKIRITVKTAGDFKFAVRIPAWCKKYNLSLNGVKVTDAAVANYVTFNRSWQNGDVIELELDMPVNVMRSNFKITNNMGRIALMRGPVVYACESVDNPDGIANMRIDTEGGFELVSADGLPENVVAVRGKAIYEEAPDTDSLYFSGSLICKEGTFTAIPYHLWQNRGAAKMAVWIREK